MRTYHKIVTPPPPAGREKTLADIPGELLEAWGIKLFSLMNLTWDYIDTICDLCVAMRLQPTKPLVRLVRELKRNYDSFRSLYVHSGFQRKERRNGELIEENLSLDFKKLFYSLSNEVSKLGLADDHKSLVIAVQQALTLMDAVKVYARRCDREIAAMGVWVCDCCLVHTEFLKLYDIIPQFAGDCYQPDIEARRLTAGIIARRLAEMPVKKAPQGETPPLVIRKK